MYQLKPLTKKDVRDSAEQRPLLQPKLKVGQPGDKYEIEADRVADRVMRMSEGEPIRMQPMEEEEDMLQPKIRLQPEKEEEELQMMCEDCRNGTWVQRQPLKEEEEMLQPNHPRAHKLLLLRKVFKLKLITPKDRVIQWTNKPFHLWETGLELISTMSGFTTTAYLQTVA